jgi:cyanophycin synthetase
MLADGKGRQRLLAAHAMASTLMGAARHNIANGLAAAAALMASGLACATIADGLRAFSADERHDPLHGNVYDVSGVQVRTFHE